MPQGGLASAAAPFGARYERHFLYQELLQEGHLAYMSTWKRGAGYEFFFFCPSCHTSANALLSVCPRKQEIIGFESFPEDMTEWINKAAHKAHLSGPTQVIAFIRRSREEVCVCVCLLYNVYCI